MNAILRHINEIYKERSCSFVRFLADLRPLYSQQGSTMTQKFSYLINVITRIELLFLTKFLASSTPSEVAARGEYAPGLSHCAMVSNSIDFENLYVVY